MNANDIILTVLSYVMVFLLGMTTQMFIDLRRDLRRFKEAHMQAANMAREVDQLIEQFIKDAKEGKLEKVKQPEEVNYTGGKKK